ncbi:3-dehydroquinate synthase [Chitinophaga sedimenti]|uniref:3-dehydroquinate synthase n=1 Tax=Chitinophaga sedimenti TaxID=2033606 RepID=UPI002002F9D0|nr:3-dehydroquinate synthase [Chitinophaga sedimenti]MCK7557733.1 3-dehydroquinate synthase [Chitinophaga sedimenti]
MAYIQQSFSVKFEYRVFFTEKIFDSSNSTFADFLEAQAAEGIRKKLLFIIDEGVTAKHGYLQEQITAYCEQLDNFELVQDIVVVPGEAAKNDLQLFYWLINELEKYAIDRHSYVIGIGGGSVLDLVGYVAAVSHRGVKHIRIPTTVLSQNDSGVGVKNGINYHGKKNFLGSFAPPVAVFNDAFFLTTLHERDWRSGMTEAVKVALIKDAGFFEWMEANATKLSMGDLPAMQQLIYRCAALHMAHIGGAGDPFESGSSRPLDFGHWSAHKLEQLSDFELRHGEAVSIGIALDSVYSFLLGWLSEDELLRIINLLKQLRLPLYHPLLEADEDEDNPGVVAGLEEFREHLGGQLTISLLRAIGRGEEVHVMDTDLLQRAMTMLRDNW